MSYTIHEYPSLEERADALGLQRPTSISIVPRGFEDASSRDELYHESSAGDLVTLFRVEGVDLTKIDYADTKIPEIQENDFTLILPCIVVTALVTSENPDAVSVALGIVANYATSFFKGITGKPKVRFDVVVEESGRKKTKKIHYEGDPDGIEALADVVRSTFHEQD